MKRISTFFSNRKRISLVLILSSLFALVLFGTPLIQSSLSENKSNKSTKTIGQSTALLVPNISASMVNTISTDNDGDTKADPGDVIQYTATITNSGADPATGVSFNATLDANTTFVPLSVDISPIAVNDGYSSIGNVGITVPAGSGVLANDLNPNGGALTITSAPSSSTNGGAVSVNTTDGSFTYNPPVGFEGSDTFTYTLGNGTGLTDTATVTINVSGMIWFINNNAGACSATCNGRLSNPFTTLAAFNTVNVGGGSNPDNNDNIFIYESSTGYSGAVTLRTGQKLIGQDATATLASITGITVPPFSSPALPTMNSANGTITNLTSTTTLNTNAVVRGLSINSTTSTGINDPAGAITGVSISEIATVTTTTGTAVSLSDFGGTVTLTSVSANGGANGIFLQNTTGSFTVVGDGTNTSVGGNSSGGTISNATGADGTTMGIGVYMNNTQNVTLRRMTINGTNQNYAIRGTTVSNFNLEYSTVAGTNGNNAVQDEGSIRFSELTGSAGILNCNISGGFEDNFRLGNTSGTLNRITFTGTTIGANSTTDGNDGITIETLTSANINATVQNCTFTSARGDLFQFNSNASSGATDDLIFNNNTLSNNHPGIATGGGGTSIFSNGAKNFTFHIEGNSFRDAVGHNLLLVKSTGTSTYSGTLTNNTIGVAAVANSGSKEGSALKIQSAGQGTVTVAVTNNQIFQYNNNGIEVLAGGGATAFGGTLDLTITGNTVSNPGNDVGTSGIPKNAIHFNIGTIPGDTYFACGNITGNNIFLGGKDAIPPTVGDNDVRLRQRQSTTIRMPGYGGGAADATAAQNFVIANNSVGGVPTALAFSVSSPPGGGYVGGAACTLPSTFAEYLGGENKELVPTNQKDDSTKEISANEPIASEPLSLSNSLSSIGNTFSRIYNGLGEAISIPDFVPTTSAQKGKVSIEASNLPAAIGTLPAGESVTVRFRASVNNPLPTPQVSPSTPAVASVSAMGTVSGSNFSSTNTNASSRNIEVPSNVVSGNGTTVFGQNVMLTATVSATGTTPNGGTVRFFDGTTQIGTDQVLTGGTASVSTTSLSVGTHNNIRAVYNGQNGVNGSISAAVTHTVNMANTTTTITNAVALGTATNVGQSYAVNWSVTVNSPGSGTPIGNVTVSDGTDTCMAAASAGTCNLTSTTSGLKNITAMYAGDTNFNTSTSASVPHTVNVPTATDVPVDFDGDGKSDPAVIVMGMPLFADEEVVVVGGDILARERQRIWSDSYQRLLHLRSGRGFVELPKDVQAAQWKWNNSSTKNPFENLQTEAGLMWQIRQSSNGMTLTYMLGTNTDIIVPCDYDGDGRADAAVWTPSTGMFTVLFSSDLSTHTYALGNMTSDPTVVGDYDGDGKCDPAVYDKSTGMWSYLGGTNHTVLTQVTFGANGIPAPGDYDGDGKFDFGIQVPPTSDSSIAKFRIAYNDGTVQFPDLGIAYGLAIFSIVPGDYDGDGKTDIAQANLMGTDIAWRVLQSSTGYTVQVKTDFGLVATDRTVQGDYDGDGKTDLAVFRSAMSPQDGVFIIRQSSTSTTVTIDFGGLNDYPVAFFNTH